MNTDRCPKSHQNGALAMLVLCFYNSKNKYDKKPILAVYGDKTAKNM